MTPRNKVIIAKLEDKLHEHRMEESKLIRFLGRDEFMELSERHKKLVKRQLDDMFDLINTIELRIEDLKKGDFK